jgi:hypothetical protein
MTEMDEKKPRNRWSILKGIAYKLAALILWLVTAALGLVEVYLLRQTVMRLHARFVTNTPVTMMLGQVVPVIAGFIWMFFAIGSAEYHLKKVGTSGSWKFFAWTVAIELLILILYFVV